MIAAAELNIIVNSYPNAPKIVIEEDVMERRGESHIYTLHRADGDYTVTGLGWGHGTLFVGTKERGTTGIRYEHEPIYSYEEEDEPVCACGQMTLDAWTVGE